MERDVNISQVTVQDGFWSSRQQLVTDVVIPYQEKILNDEIEGVAKSHAFANFRIAAGLESGEFYGMVFQDSDVAKWLEGVAYSLAVKPDEALEKRADAIIDIIGQAQEEDGYLNTFFSIKEPEHKWQNLQECHELYCAGHMMEAAVAYYDVTGKRQLLDIMEKMAIHIDERFGVDKELGVPGHQEIEIGLMRLYHTTGEKRYLDLASFFIDQRGQNPNFFVEEAEKRGWKHFGIDAADTLYNQSFAPVREQEKAEGHSVRAVYMYTAMADIARETGDKELQEACERLWDNMVNQRMYITAGIGSTVEGEAFSIDYDLPNDTVYAETCAAIGLVFFAREMLKTHVSNKYTDVMERALYNGMLSGMQLDGKRFFYVNPLEVNPGVSGKLHGHKHVLPQRPGWYECACCPPNVVRTVTSLAKYAWGEDENTIYSHLYLGGELDSDKATVRVHSQFPWEGKITYEIEPSEERQDKPFCLAIRIPSYAEDVRVTLKDEDLVEACEMKEGYLYIERLWQSGDSVEVLFDMPVRRVRTNTAVRHNAGHVALMRGPLVYCFEGVDNEGLLQELRIPVSAPMRVTSMHEDGFDGMKGIEFTGKRVVLQGELYSEALPEVEDIAMRAIPYFAWGNRGENQMKVWMMESFDA